MNAHAQTSVQDARREYDRSHFDNWSSEAQLAVLHNLMAAEQAVETLDQRCFRLGLAAADADSRADQLEAEGAQDDLVVVARRARFGADDEPAKNIAARAVATKVLAADYRAEAVRLRSQASALRRSQRYAADVLASLHAAQ